MVERSDRLGMSGIRVAGGLDLLEDMRRTQRQKVFRRAAKLTVLGAVLLSIGVGFKVLAERRGAGESVQRIVTSYESGSALGLQVANALLERSSGGVTGHSDAASLSALMSAHLYVEFEEPVEIVHQRIRAAPDSAARHLAQAMVEFASGEGDRASARLDALPDYSDSLVDQERLWLRGMIAMARSTSDPSVRAQALAELERGLDTYPRNVPMRRVYIALLIGDGQHDVALEQLAKARDQSRAHFGLAADEALYNAYLKRELSGVASVSDQLLALEVEQLSSRDRAHAYLARAVAGVQMGHVDAALDDLDRAWGGLEAWNTPVRELAIQTALEAGDSSRLDGWLAGSGLPETQQAVYRAWGILQTGDIMQALDRLAALPQEDPIVGYLQALALVEQGRYDEAQPWIERTETLLPGRLEIEVAKARVDLRVGDKRTALRRLQALAKEEESFAPRAWTGLGEAYLLQEGDARNLDAAQQALERAIEVEPIPAEAHRLMAEVCLAERDTRSKAEVEALAHFEAAAQTNPALPRYAETLALHLADMGFIARARELLAKQVEVRGVQWPVMLRWIQIELEVARESFEEDAALAKLEALGAPAATVARERARARYLEGTRSALQSAVTQLEALVDADPNDLESRVLLARVFAAMRDKKAAKAVLLRGYALMPEEREGPLDFELAAIQARFGPREQAAPRARRAWLLMKAERRTPNELMPVAELAAQLWLRTEHAQVAITLVRDLTERVPYHGKAWAIRAQTELAVGDTSYARRSAEKAIELDANLAEAYVVLGHSLLRFGQKEEARVAYAEAVALSTGTEQEADYRAHLARL